jgi:hypothetical protein
MVNGGRSLTSACCWSGEDGKRSDTSTCLRRQTPVTTTPWNSSAPCTNSAVTSTLQHGGIEPPLTPVTPKPVELEN